MKLEVAVEGNNRYRNERVVLVLLAKTYYNDSRVTQEAESLINNGFKVYVFSWDREGKFKDTIKDNLVVRYVKLLPSDKFGKIRYAFSAIAFQILAIAYGMKLLKKYRKIIVHANDFNTLLAPYSFKFFYQSRIKVIYDSHELTPAVYHEWYGRTVGKIVLFLEKVFIKCSDAVLATSETIFRYLKEITKKPTYLIYNYPTEKIIPKVNKTEARTSLALPKDSFIVSFVGTMRSDMAIIELLEASLVLKRERENRIKVVLVGSGPLRERIQKYIHEMGLEDIVLVIPRVPREKAILYTLASDLTYAVFKGEKTTFGLPWKMFESLITGTNVMTDDGNCTAEFLRKIKMGIILEKTDPKEIARKMVDLKEKEAWLPREVRREFTWESQEEKFINIYVDVWEQR